MPAVVEMLPTSSDEDEVLVPQPPAQTPGEAEAVVGAVPDKEAVGDCSGVNLAECDHLKQRGNALFGEGKVDEALAEYRKAIACAPIKPVRRPKPSAAVATAAGTCGDGATDEPERPSTVAEDKDENTEGKAEQDSTDYTLTSQVFCNAGYCLLKLELYDEAVDMLSEAIRHNEEYQKAYLRRADSYYTLEKWSSAYGDYENYMKLGGVLDAGGRARRDHAKAKMDEEMKKMLSDLKDLGNRFLGNFGLSTDMFKFDKDPATGGYSMRFERE